MTVSDIKRITDRDTEVILRDYVTNKFVKHSEETREMGALNVLHIYAKCHECGTPKKLKTQIVLSVVIPGMESE